MIAYMLSIETRDCKLSKLNIYI